MAIERMSVSEIKVRSAQSEPHWFSAKTMRFFKTKLHGKGYVSANKERVYFITSEQFGGERTRRTYRIRCMRMSDGSIFTVKRHDGREQTSAVVNYSATGTELEFFFLWSAQDAARDLAQNV